jgi:cytochrome c oxidase cbb3-type subunit 3
MSPFWHWYVIVIVGLSLAGCLWLLFANSRGTPGENTGHVWDDNLTEYNNPLPRWWLNTFIITIVFAIGYLVVYPGVIGGTAGWTSRDEMQRNLATLQTQRNEIFALYKDKDVLALSKEAGALSLGRSVFLQNCAGCHGADAHGALGFPNLADNDWLFGGDPDTLVQTITNGRQGMMPPLGAAMAPEALNALLDFIPYWSDPKLAADKREAGMKQFAITCAPCHGADGKGNHMLGSPNLTDDIWLFGGGREHIRETLTQGRQAAMPAHKDLLSSDDIRMVSAYVYSLSHGSAEQK